MEKTTLVKLSKNFDKYEIISFGETHHGKHEKIFKELNKYVNSFDGIFYEQPISDQGSLNYYIETGNLDTRLTEYLERAKKEGNDIKQTLTTIMDFSRNHNLPLIAIDSSKKQTDVYRHKSDIGNYYHKENSREEDMFNNIIENVQARKRWLLICGARHLALGKHWRSNDNTLGTRLFNRFGNKFLRTALVSGDIIEDYIQDFDYYIA